MSTLDKMGGSLWKGFKSIAKTTAKIGSDLLADTAEALEGNVKNAQANAKSSIDAKPGLDSTTKTVAKIGTDLFGYTARGALGIARIFGRAVKKNL